MRFDIVSIKMKGCTCLGKNGKPINPRKPIWEKGLDVKDGDGSKSPGAFVLYKSYSTAKKNKTPYNEQTAVLELNVEIPLSLKGTQYLLQGYYDKEIVLFSGCATVQRAEQSELTFTVTAKYRPEGFFYLCGEHIHWQLSRSDSTQKSGFIPTYLELFWLYSYNCELFKKVGAPVEILREAARACRLTGQIQRAQFQHSEKDNKKTILIKRSKPFETEIWKWIVEEIVLWCFHRNPPAYDIIQPFDKYIYEVNKKDGAISFDLPVFLDALTNQWATCNCDDQASVLQYYLKAIGISNVTYYKMKPFGFLRLTKLAGRKWCNNPGYGDGKNAIVGTTVWNRKPFDRHTFCFLKELGVLDSCIGPHTGGETIDQYVENAVDKCHPPLEEQLNICKKGTPRFSPAKNKKITPMVGVVASGESLRQKKKPEPTSAFTINFLLEDEGPEARKNEDSQSKKAVVREWYKFSDVPIINDPKGKLFEEIIPGPDEVMKKWTFYKDDRYINIEIYVSSSDNQLSLNRFAYLGDRLYQYVDPEEIKSPNQSNHWVELIRNDLYRRHLWVAHNVVVNILFSNVPDCDVDKMLDVLRKMSQSPCIKAGQLAEQLPPLDFKRAPNDSYLVDEDVELTIELQDKEFVDFSFVEGNGLQLIEKERSTLVFCARQPSENKLIVFAVNENTLLVRKSDEIKITIKEKQQSVETGESPPP